MAQGSERISNLVSYTVSADHERPDLEACLEISDRVNATKPECMEAIGAITKNLLSSNYKIVLNSVQLLETLCKNCNMRFLYELNNKKLVEALSKNLEKRRERTKSKTKSTKPVDKLKLQIEDKILYLVQLWADTFMMHQEEFNNVHALYRNLRKDGVKFPERDPNEKFMMNFQGQTSPIFIAMDENYIVPSNNQGGPAPDPRLQTQSKNFSKEPEYKHEVMPNSGAQNTLYNEEDEYDYSVYDGVEISSEEVKVLEESISILKEIEAHAVVPGDMKSEIANEILGDLAHVHKRIKRFAQSDKFISTNQRNEALRLNDMITSCLTSYKARYSLLKENYAKGIKTEPLAAQNGKEDKSNGESGKASTDLTSKGFLGARKLAPPKGWKVPQTPKETPNTDLIDLMDHPGPKEETTTPNEEKKEEALQENEKKLNYVDDLLGLDFSPNSHQPTNLQNQALNYNFSQAQQIQQASAQNLGFMGAMPQPQLFNQAFPGQFGTVPIIPVQNQVPFNPAMMGAYPNNINMFATQPVTNVVPPFNGVSQFGVSVQGQPQTNPTNTAIVQNQAGVVGGPKDDDDFFNDIANRKK